MCFLFIHVQTETIKIKVSQIFTHFLTEIFSSVFFEISFWVNYRINSVTILTLRKVSSNTTS